MDCVELGVIIPVYNEGEGLYKNIIKIEEYIKKLNITYNIILVNDGSIDNSWSYIEKLCESPHIKGICFSRNFGKEAAVFAGLRSINANATIVMDADLQHPPSLISQMYNEWKNGYKIIEAVKNERVDSWFSKQRASIYNKLLKNMTGLDLQNSSDYKLIDKIVLDNLLTFTEVNTFYRAMITWTGLPTKQLFFDVNERDLGESKFTLKALIKLAIQGIVSFSSIPLQIVSIVGFLFFLFAILLGAQTIFNYYNGNAVTGFTTVILLILISGSVTLLGLGIIGLYVSKIYEEVKKRPQYIILKTIQ